MMTIARHQAELDSFERALPTMPNAIMRDTCQCLIDGARAAIATLEAEQQLAHEDTMKHAILKSPFPYFGGKSRVAPLVWERFGTVANYVEPFFGSGAVLLGCPHPGHTETVNDADALLANFFRALQADPDGVAQHADWPVNEVDLHARHQWLVNRRAWVEELMTTPDAYDVKVAGWWVWGISQWIGSGWCADMQDVYRKHPHLISNKGVNRQLPHVGDAGRGEHRAPTRKMPLVGGTRMRGAGVHSPAKGNLFDYFAALADRLRRVRVCCGDWQRVLGPSVTTGHGMTAIFLDPPYTTAERDTDLYAVDRDVFADVRAWAIANGDNPLLRIAVCGYQDGYVWPDGWQAHAWKANGGYGSQGTGRGRENAARETLWFSPNCLKPAELAREQMTRPITVRASSWTGTLFEEAA